MKEESCMSEASDWRKRFVRSWFRRDDEIRAGSSVRREGADTDG